MYDAIGTSATGLATHRMWIDVLANNIANVNTVKSTDEDAFQAVFVRASALPENRAGIGRGVTATELPRGDADGILTYDPEHPLADDEGYVRRPDINMSSQMADLMLAQRGFQANAQMVEKAKELYEAAIGIGKGI